MGPDCGGKVVVPEALRTTGSITIFTHSSSQCVTTTRLHQQTPTMAIVKSTAVAFLAAQAASAATLRAHRQLSFLDIAGYQPNSQVTDHAAIDLDQAALESQLALRTEESFDAAKQIYLEGGNSKSYAEIVLGTPLSGSIGKGAKIHGKNDEGKTITGKALDDYTSGTTQISVQYDTTDEQDVYVQCQVGALPKAKAGLENTVGCFSASGNLKIDGTEYPYSYNPLVDNNNARTISGFSTGAMKKMYSDCPGCPYVDYEYYYNYYGAFDYANQWVLSALDGSKTNFNNGNADFSKFSLVGRQEAAKKGTAYMNIFMYVIREWEDALDDCKENCINCNDDPVHAWDEGVAFYTGSMEGTDGSGDGKLLHGLADKRCTDFATCGTNADAKTGTAKVNYDLFDHFALGQHQLLVGNCAAARTTKEKIVDIMYIPLVQGTIRYAYKVAKLQGAEKEKAEGAVFAAAVLPRIAAANPNAAEKIYTSMKVGASSTDFHAVKSAFESTYRNLGITCKQVGGLWNDATGSYYEGASPCKDASTKANKGTTGIIVGSVFAGVAVIAVGFVLFMRRREIKGQPVFQTKQVDEGADMN